MYPGSSQAYDRAITVFSPDGRLFQVEYAKEAVRRGATTAGLVCSDGVVLVALKTIISPLLVADSMKKVFLIDDHLGATASGLVADARRLVDMGRLEAQKHKLSYSEPAPIETIARDICDMMQVYTQYGGIRPFGVSLLIAGVDSEPRLFEAEPSGALTGYKADAIGSGKKDVDAIFEKEYRDGMNTDEGISLALKALKKTVETKLRPENIDIGVVPTKTKSFVMLSQEEIAKHISKT